VFSKIAQGVSHAVGSPWVFSVALAVVLIWGASGPLFGFSEVWQLVINTGTTIVTFLMVFLIQNTQNRNDWAVQKKLDELITRLDGPRDEIAGIEETEPPSK